MKTTDPVTSAKPLNTHTGIDGMDTRVHYPKGFRTANDNSFIVKANDGSIEYQSALQHKRVVIPSADILQLKSVPFEAIEAPGEDCIIIPVLVNSFNNFGTVAYNFADGLLNLVHEADLLVPLISIAATFNQATGDLIRKSVGNSINIAIEDGNNQALMFYCPDADPTTGDGVQVHDIYYYIMDLTDYDSSTSGDGVGDLAV